MIRFFYIFIAYSLAAIAAVIGYLATSDTELWRFFYASMAASSVIFVFSFCFDNSSFYDAYRGLAPILIATSLLIFSSSGNLTRELLVLGLIVLWGLRLTFNWGSRWQGLQDEDWRYQNLQAQTGIFYWPVSLIGIHLFPSAIVFFVCLPLFEVFGQSTALGYLDLIAFAVTLSAITLEAIADRQLQKFIAIRATAQDVLTTGVWSWCRHPNYLGEISFWVGIFLFGLAASNGAGNDLMKLGPISMVLMFIIVSIPMSDQKLLETKPEYAAYKQRTFALLPFSRLRG